jgi:hypothetical protein
MNYRKIFGLLVYLFGFLYMLTYPYNMNEENIFKFILGSIPPFLFVVFSAYSYDLLLNMEEK